MMGRDALMILVSLVLFGCPSDPAPVSDGGESVDADAAVSPEVVDVGSTDVEVDGAQDGGGDPDLGPEVEDAGEVDTPVDGDAGPDVADAADDTADIEEVAVDAGSGDADSDAGPTQSPWAGAVVFNEALIDADTDTLLDPNGDGDLDATDDEFVELVNLTAASVDLSGFALVEEDFPGSPRHVFGPGATLEPGQAVVIFGGGEAPDPIEGAWFVVAQNSDPGISFGLHLTDAGNRLSLVDAEGLLVDELAYGSAGGPPVPEDESLTRWPDGSGDWVGHGAVAPAGEIFSPGTKVDGSSFGP